MFPHEAQEMMAKFLFFLFALLILSFSKIHACALSEGDQSYFQQSKAQQLSFLEISRSQKEAK